ncbi:unnamed protein product [Diplocarpon coronariae]|uniref:Transmembrane protein n=1 Tax=Diplocarpon coronariae TaxID=2795749 RepID=A0A218YU71_9HELO|nr:hypothetical protein B2J93_6109 [Marssonina coronariae]
MLIHRTSLFSSPSSSSPNGSPPSTKWIMPNSYRVAIFLDASILLLILFIVLGVVLYVRRRKAPFVNRRRCGGVDAEEEMLLEHKVEDEPDNKKRKEMSEKIAGAGACVSIVREAGKAMEKEGKKKEGKKKKGHVRWTPSVQGGEVFGIMDVVKEIVYGSGNKDVEEAGKEGMQCACGGRRHIGCWRHGLDSASAVPALKLEKEKGRGRARSWSSSRGRRIHGN